MAVEYCHTCGNYRDLDWESEGEYNEHFEYKCEDCCLNEAEECAILVSDTKEVTDDRDSD